VSESSATFASHEIALFWRYIASTLDRLIELASDLDGDGLSWHPPADGANDIRTLNVHTMGNAEENIIDVLGGRPVNRDRDSEFTTQSISGRELAEHWATLRSDMVATLCKIPASELDRVRTHPRRGDMTGRDALIVVARHSAEHLGQAELTRDLWERQKQQQK
jgi:uncharacterized damage-inducible protein DinB